MLSVFAREVKFIEEMEESSKTYQIYLDGYICKEPVYRKTPLGREIADLLLADVYKRQDSDPPGSYLRNPLPVCWKANYLVYGTSCIGCGCQQSVWSQGVIYRDVYKRQI